MIYSPYLHYSLKLKQKPRRGGGNMFRHQMETLAILIDYGFTDTILLKASLIHDLIEDVEWTEFHDYDEIEQLDEDGKAVVELVKEVSQNVVDGVKEPKGEFLLRIMEQGTQLAKTLKLADRISNLTGLPLTGHTEFIRSYTGETERFILPYAKSIHPGMAEEIAQRLENIKHNLK